MRPLQETYGMWFFAQETEPTRGSSAASAGKLLAFRCADDLQRACAEDALLSPQRFDDLFSNGRFPGLANIGVPSDHPHYVETRRAWIEVSLESIFDDVEEYLHNPYQVWPGELVFQAYMILDGSMSLVTLHHDAGLTFACPGSDRESLQRLAAEIDEIAGNRLEAALLKIRTVTAQIAAAR
jgi:hypothetical protein